MAYRGIGIDVFKGNKSPTQKTYPDNDLPWINDKQVSDLVQRIKSGEQGLIEKAKKSFKISKANLEKLTTA